MLEGGLPFLLRLERNSLYTSVPKTTDINSTGGDMASHYRAKTQVGNSLATGGEMEIAKSRQL